ncbi:hypothetical protein BDZ97DRAFT_2063769 [Flammula alnicola]|nr:hypothetical protein BDZ97DRAFT_2063769 [Flammula alnicola]
MTSECMAGGKIENDKDNPLTFTAVELKNEKISSVGHFPLPVHSDTVRKRVLERCALRARHDPEAFRMEHLRNATRLTWRINVLDQSHADLAIFVGPHHSRIISFSIIKFCLITGRTYRSGSPVGSYTGFYHNQGEYQWAVAEMETGVPRKAAFFAIHYALTHTRKKMELSKQRAASFRRGGCPDEETKEVDGKRSYNVDPSCRCRHTRMIRTRAGPAGNANLRDLAQISQSSDIKASSSKLMKQIALRTANTTCVSELCEASRILFMRGAGCASAAGGNVGSGQSGHPIDSTGPDQRPIGGLKVIVRIILQETLTCSAPWGVDVASRHAVHPEPRAISSTSTLASHYERAWPWPYPWHGWRAYPPTPRMCSDIACYGGLYELRGGHEIQAVYHGT